MLHFNGCKNSLKYPTPKVFKFLLLKPLIVVICMFGKGVYFADMFSKSKGYSFYENSVCKDGVLLLCEVALGEMVELQEADFSANILPPRKLSTKGMGRRGPNPKEARTLEDGVVVLLGCPVDLMDYKSQLWHNEYIVYDLGQIRMRYLIHVRIQPGN